MKPGYSVDDEMQDALKSIDRHIQGLTHARDKLSRLRESGKNKRGSEPPGSHPQDERAAESKSSDDVGKSP